MRANIMEAKSAIVFADARIDESALVDGKSLLIVSSIERIAPNVHTTVEIVQEKHVQNFRYNHVNEFVLSHDAVSRLAVRAARGKETRMCCLLSRQHGDDITKWHWTLHGTPTAMPFGSLCGKGDAYLRPQRPQH